MGYMHMEERPREDTERRWPYVNQVERTQKKPNLPIT